MQILFKILYYTAVLYFLYNIAKSIRNYFINIDNKLEKMIYNINAIDSSVLNINELLAINAKEQKKYCTEVLSVNKLRDILELRPQERYELRYGDWVPPVYSDEELKKHINKLAINNGINVIWIQ